MSAKEMFEELEFECFEIKGQIYYYMEFRDYGDDTFDLGVKFNLSTQEIFCDLDIGMDLLKAINQQCKELGWINER